jgi:hypothetical protein
MGKKASAQKPLKFERPKRTKLSAEDSLKRMQAFGKRKEKFIATVRKGKNRGLSA